MVAVRQRIPTERGYGFPTAAQEAADACAGPDALDLSEINPHAALWASESFVSDNEREWLRWVRRAEKLLGHSIDGNQATDGYSLDYAHDYFANMDTVEVYVADVREAKAELEAAFGPVV